jgi:F-type H+-transporting ATPase subunit delta
MSVVAIRYAKALMDVLYPEKAEAGAEQLRSFAALLAEQSDAKKIFENPAISAHNRKGLLREISEALEFDRHVASFADILIERNRLGLLDEIIRVYQRLLDERFGLVRAVITTAQPLDAVQRAELAAKLESMTGKQVRMEMEVDPSLIGGVVARLGSTIYDGSVRQQLQTFKRRLVEG